MSLKRRIPVLYLILAIFCAPVLQTPAKAQSATEQSQAWCGNFDVMTQNMYVGTDFSEIFAAQDFPTLLAEVAEAFSDVQSRIAAIGHAIKTTKPDLVTLQEVALWQTGPFDPTTPSANTVAYDYLQLLLDELNKNESLHYEAAAVLTNLVAEAPAIGPAGLFDVRFTDRVALLARTDLGGKNFNVHNVNAQHFSTVLSVPTTTLGLITIPRGYISADVEQCGQTFRFVTAHLESFEEQLGLQFPFFRFAQAAELLQGPASTSLPVVLAGDFNADAQNPADPTYQLLLSGAFLDSWNATSPDKPGFTWPLFLENPFVYTSPTQRLDLVLTRGAINAEKVELIGNRNVTPNLPMSSDHAGVVAILQVQ
jgi:endonuclease/exonuclease/phosphatase family metal-dependent hydrolase